MSAPLMECDLVLKGGVTSGVVYPRAIVELSRKYRFRSVGGTSAGAIAAIVTGAAEYGRDTGGFDKVGELPEDLAHRLIDRFQPYPRMRPLFQVLLASISGSRWSVIGAAAAGYARSGLLWALPGLALLLIWLAFERSVAVVLIGLVAVLSGYAFGVARALFQQAMRDLPEHDYGMCGGLSAADVPGPSALTTWLTDLIDDVAGRSQDGPPIGVADLAGRGIVVQTITTDISTRRPYALPMENNLYFFDEVEFRGLFPKRVVDEMIRQSAPVRDAPEGLHYFRMENLPLVVLVRLSLSFPGLISAVPLWRRDHTLVNAPPEQQYRRCLFADGGLSSNFPVSLFDAFLPQRPTFGISLGGHDALRNRDRVFLPFDARQGQLIPVQTFSGLGGFVGALIDSAKDWQDTLQSVLPGQRERIVTINLREHEGGLNLEMSPQTIRDLSNYGQQAGNELVQRFDLNEHKWRRYLVEVRALDEALQQFARSWDAAPQAGSLSYRQIASEYEPQSFTGLSASERVLLQERAESIAQLGEELSSRPDFSTLAIKLPVSRSKVRVIARMED